jgi:hypothetical protein
VHKNTYHFILLIICLININTTLADEELSVPSNELEFHVIYSEKLRVIMQRMNQLIYVKELSELRKEEIRTQNLDELVYAVNELGFAAIILTKALPGFNLTSEEKDIFQAISIQLQREAENIKIMFEENDYASMERSYKRLNDTCAACHELFRL